MVREKSSIYIFFKFDSLNNIQCGNDYLLLITTPVTKYHNKMKRKKFKHNSEYKKSGCVVLIKIISLCMINYFLHLGKKKKIEKEQAIR